MPKGHYQCDKCPTVFSVHASLIRHQEAHRLSESVPSLGNETEKGLKLQEIKVQYFNLLCTYKNFGVSHS